MTPTQFLRKIFNQHCQNIHATRLNALIQASEGLIQGKKLSLTGLGRGLVNPAKVKNNIKKIDRLLGNRNICEDRLKLYKASSRLLIGTQGRPVVLVDWSSVRRQRDLWIIRASIPLGGRSLSLYEEVYPEKLLDNLKITKRFLLRLKEILPEACKPILVTDAGFRGPWFKVIQELGWDFVGRIRGMTSFRWLDAKKWEPCKTLHPRATYEAEYLGQAQIVESNPYIANLFTMRGRPKNRIHRTIRGTRFMGSSSRKQAKGAVEPWLLSTSLSPTDQTAKTVVEIYKSRMQIECSFRDVKNQRNGFSLSETLSKDPQRIEALLLIGMIATLALWLAGAVGYKNKLQYEYQANTVKTRRILSLFSLGIGMFSSAQHYVFTAAQLFEMLFQMQHMGLQI